MHKTPNTNLSNVFAAPKKQIIEHLQLDRYSWPQGSEEEHTIMAMQQMVANNPNDYFFEIQRVPDKIDKEICNKENPWHHWVIQNVQQALYAFNYFTVLHSMLKQVSEKHNIPFTSQYVFHHTKHMTITARSDTSLFYKNNLANKYNGEQLK
jgi:hypothetical protein